jgi:TolB protein
VNNRASLLASGLACLSVLGSCLDHEGILETDGITAIASVPTVSNPLSPPSGSAIAARFSATVNSEMGIVYVSLPPGTVPEGGFATLRENRTGVSIPVPMANGGFDPVSVSAEAGDTIAIEVQLTGGAIVRFALAVPHAARPVVVRTQPPRRKRDVPLNTSIVVVFSEPIRAGSETGVRLLRNGQAVGGDATISTDGLRITFQPSALLAPNADYAISISNVVRDLVGDALAQSVTQDFTTGETSIAASVATDPAALFTNPFAGELRSFTMSAVRYSNGLVSGSFNIFYPGPGWRQFGRVTCFTIVDGKAAWIAGVVESANDTTVIGVEYGWRAADNAGDLPDELSLAFPFDSLGSAAEFCANTPTSDPINGEITLIPLISGNIVVNGSGPPPPPPPAVSKIAFAAWPNGGIQVVNADGSGGLVLSSDSGDFSPAWSPDGGKVAFDRNRGDQFAGDIYVINADGSGLRPLTHDGSDDSDPAWSPDGRLIAFGRNGGIYVMNAADGSGLRAVTVQSCDYHPTWAPDGLRIAFASCRGGTNAIYVMNADGSGIRSITKDSRPDYAPWWSPDGSKIAFQRDPCCDYPSIYIVNPDGTGPEQVAPIGRTPSWSWDGKAIVFELFGLQVVNADGTGLHALGNGYDPAWSPTGSLPAPLPLAASVSLEPKTDTVVVGDSLRIFATVRDAGGNVMPGRLAAWSNSDLHVVVLQPGYGASRKVTGWAEGITRITATVDGRSDTAVLVVVP